MRKLLILIFGLLALALVACAGNAAPTPTPVPEAAPAGDVPAPAVEEASGKPQLVEFYADW